MTERLRRRLGRGAAVSVAHLVLLVALLVAGLTDSDVGWLVLLVAAVPMLLAWGPFQTDVTLNPALDEPARTRWRVTLWCLPWCMALYWWRFVRSAR